MPIPLLGNNKPNLFAEFGLGNLLIQIKDFRFFHRHGVTPGRKNTFFFLLKKILGTLHPCNKYFFKISFKCKISENKYPCKKRKGVKILPLSGFSLHFQQ